MKDYKKILEGVMNIINTTEISDIGFANICSYISENCPELAESADERIRKAIICGMTVHKNQGKETFAAIPINDCIAWLEKQGTPAKLSEEEQNRFAKGVLTSCAMSFIDYLDAHKHEGKMCVSNGECEDIENAFHNAMWDKLHRYYSKYIEKQGKQKQDPCEHCNDKLLNCHNFPCIEKRAFEQGKSALEVIDNINDKGYCCVVTPQDKSALEATNEEKVDNVNKVEPKFKVDDWITFYGGEPFKILKVEAEQNSILDYLLLRQNGYASFYNKKYVDENARLWSIADAKPGDVLFHSDSASNGIFIFKELLKCGFSEEVICYCDYDSEDDFCLGDHHTCCWADAKILHPATKEQRDLLFQKMSDAGYTFDFDKKELKKIEQKPIIPKFKVGDIIKDTEDGEVFTIKTITKEKYIYTDGQFDWIKDQDIYELVEQKPWSEEIEAAISLLKHIAEEQEKDYCPHNANDLRKAAQYLETCRFQNKWKPTEEQMDGIKCAMKTLQYRLNVGDKRLNSLYDDLKKLKEE